jgi:thiamine biosynthesis lipoprotein
MGTRFAVQIAKDALSDTTRLLHALQTCVDAIDRQMSPWIATSNINQFNASTVGVDIQIPEQFLAVLTEAIKIEAASGGAFSPAVAPNVKYWGFSAGQARAGQAPDGTVSLHSTITLDIEKSTATKAGPVEIDLCGIAKGYGVDQLARVLRAFNLHDFVASIDGEVSAAGKHPNGGGWHIAIEAPDPKERRVHRVVECQDLCLATSGGYRHFRQNGARNVTHTIDPASGQPLAEINSSVTVASDRCCAADAWATALLVMGPTKGLAFAKSQGLNAIFQGTGPDLASGAFSHLA